ncbi:hypothetical protein B0186_08545 [Canicola haemoglobinophilus]|uniref:Keto-hydroxyglutarate-aldolase/keto-deoxy-phosphogluconate aldolase n=2 Tax=Canicola haemoglobinophilus TaxID=733 RepID=A0A1V4AZT3_9PAST|nr:2-dehydro-3-deoxy-6-phosphogalactonate aldolase [Canicola haemoglobinophilus]OOR98836.1 hypothetical protein B0186_08545 [Canicola haemoglobinophilus]STO53664.1 keto-hydroxyglutarate-aldolase/keto-deoxy-phosphogluconate aldolase [Canicola haemoglobinophilus]STO60928.1 keto-hydroxyglutarate-aldolase/keto-deoxy-phosphogluconate aldolase [Canicola haemoglobinophilus]STO68198.1 keto-hydroxyglutarate-aldolase/keto-deoxy-phosphogluconate aldolase [Canicola haemoglobinophilus]
MNMSELIQNKLPLVAILRGIQTEEALRYAQKLIELNYYFIEVPLNSPNALVTIKLLQEKIGHLCCIGAGTVTNLDELKAVLATGVKLIVTPNVNTEVIAFAKSQDCIIFSGVMTPTEAYSAIHAGTTFLKLYPAEIIGIKGLKALKAVLPKDIECFPVGGISADFEQMENYVANGASGFGIGNALYKSGMSFAEFEQNALRFKSVCERISWQK